ncbi:hypothetical protein ACE38W_14955 [Chitinophaga sp. Hz27]|uniref:hypothetical protein n=1 Tax=Chitinophaga sp. Hz27 TaxID=3347169 RepID=UPI0035E3079A
MSIQTLKNYIEKSTISWITGNAERERFMEQFKVRMKVAGVNGSLTDRLIDVVSKLASYYSVSSIDFTTTILDECLLVSLKGQGDMECLLRFVYHNFKINPLGKTIFEIVGSMEEYYSAISQPAQIPDKIC